MEIASGVETRKPETSPGSSMIPRCFESPLEPHQAWLEARLQEWVTIGYGLESLPGTFDGEKVGQENPSTVERLT